MTFFNSFSQIKGIYSNYDEILINSIQILHKLLTKEWKSIKIIKFYWKLTSKVYKINCNYNFEMIFEAIFQVKSMNWIANIFSTRSSSVLDSEAGFGRSGQNVAQRLSFCPRKPTKPTKPRKSRKPRKPVYGTYEPRQTSTQTSNKK